MENKGMIFEIKSKYILKHILKFIQNQHFELKLFFHSKYFQKRLEINYFYCYKKYLEDLDFDLDKYSYKLGERYKKDSLKKEFDNFISTNHLHKKTIKNIIYEVLNNQKETNEEKYISLDSPLFEIISKTKVFDKNYTIYISQQHIDEYNLKNDYISYN